MGIQGRKIVLVAGDSESNEYLRSTWRQRFNLAIPVYDYLLGRRLFGRELKYPLFRLGHFPEWFLHRNLYLDFSGQRKPRFRVPDRVDVPPERQRPALPELANIQPVEI